MDKAIRKQLLAGLKERFATLSPFFTCARDTRTSWLREKDTLYRAEFAPGVYCFLRVQIDSMGSQKFTIEGAVSTNGLFPFELGLMLPVERKVSDLPADDPIDGEFRFRLGSFFGRQGDHWWSVSSHDDQVFEACHSGDVQDLLTVLMQRPEALKLEPVFNDVMLKIAQHAMPFFRDVVARLRTTD